MADLCGECGGTILDPSVGGASRGSCHCRKEGYVKGRRRPAGPGDPGAWTYWVMWRGQELQQPAGTTVIQAHAVLNQLRKEAA